MSAIVTIFVVIFLFSIFTGLLTGLVRVLPILLAKCLALLFQGLKDLPSAIYISFITIPLLIWLVYDYTFEVFVSVLVFGVFVYIALFLEPRKKEAKDGKAKTNKSKNEVGKKEIKEIYMTPNPLNDELMNAMDIELELSSSINNLRKEIEWYRSTNFKVLNDSRNDLKYELESLSLKRKQLSGDIQKIEANIKDLSELINSFWNPKNWFNLQQRDFRIRKAVLLESLGLESNNFLKVQAQTKNINKQISTMVEEIEKYNCFNFDAKSKKLNDTLTQLSDQEREIERIFVRKRHVDKELAPIDKQINDAETKKLEAISVMRKAQSMEKELSNADNSYERAMVHQKCQEKFRINSPRRVISQKESEILRLDRDLKKLKRRAEIIADKSVRDIRKLILDGNNLCYQGDNFIVLAALKSLVPILAIKYEVVLVFDASIRKALGSSDSEIRNILSSDIEVHVVANNVKADETVLDLAENHKTIFVVSNDRFAEFGEKQALREQRIIRHEIVSGQILIHDLGISETFRQ